MSAWGAYIYPTIVGRFKPTDSNEDLSHSPIPFGDPIIDFIIFDSQLYDSVRTNAKKEGLWDIVNAYGLTRRERRSSMTDVIAIQLSRANNHGSICFIAAATAAT